MNEAKGSINEGAIRVQYGKGHLSKWITLDSAQKYLRPSNRPRPPRSMHGVMERHSIDESGEEWIPRYFELHQGFMTWWPSQNDAKKNSKPCGATSLLGVMLRVDDVNIQWFTCQNMGTMYTFR